MAKSPYYRIVIKDTEQDITDHVTQFSYEDSIEKDDLVILRLDGVTNEFVDETKLNKGSELVFMFGFQNGTISAKKTCTIKDIETSYQKSISITVKALDTGLLLKKLTSNRIWSKKTVSQIAVEIAGIFSMDSQVDATSVIHDAIPQANRTFFQLLTELATKEGAGDGNKGSFKFFVKGNKLYFTQRDLSKKSVRTFTYGDGSGTVKSFKPKYNQKSGESEKVSASGIDVDILTSWTSSSSSKDSKETGVGQVKISYDINGIVVDSLPETNSGKNIVSDSTTEADAKKSVTGKQKDAEMQELTATLSIDGDPTIVSDTIITMSGVSQKHAGNYYVTEVVHSISKSGFSTELKLNKNAALKAPLEMTKDVDKKNKSQGAVNADSKNDVPVINYDINGEVQV